VSFVILAVLATPFLVDDNKIKNAVPRCEWKVKYNKECPFCGMTTGFLLISKGRFSEASESNRLSLFLYSIFVINEIVILAVILGKATGVKMKR